MLKIFFLLLAVACNVCGAAVLCPNGQYVNTGPCTLCPDGSYIGGGGHCTLAPDGKYVNGTPRLTPNGGYVGEPGMSRAYYQRSLDAFCTESMLSILSKLP